MKKIFTSISMALCLVASSFTTSAQTVQLSEAQKTEIQKEVLPVVFEQIKEQTGLDILGWAQPQLTNDFIGNLPVLNNLQSGLRADTPTPYSVKPDSILISTAAIDAKIAKLLGGKLKITFGNYTETGIPLVEQFLGRPLTVSMPGLITVTAPEASQASFQHLVDISIISNELADGEMMNMDVNAVLFNDPKNNTLELIGLKLAVDATAMIKCNLDIKEGFHNIWGLMGILGVTLPTLPDVDYLVTVGLSGLATMTFPASLYGIPEANPATQIPMGDAQISLDFSKQVPINNLAITSYENAVAKEWRKFWFSQAQVGSDFVLTIDEAKFSSVWADSVYAGSVIITMSDLRSVVSDTESAMQSVIDRVVSELSAEGKATWYKMAITAVEADINGDGNVNSSDAMPVMDIEVTPYISGTDAIADINIKSYGYSETKEVTTTEMNVKATANLTNKVIKVDVIPAGSPVAVGSAYFTSNIAGIVTSNDDITINTVKVTPVDGGIYIDNSGKATYRIVNMSGATVANGTVSGDNAYISTSSLTKGVYVIVVTENGVSQSVKFARY